MEGKISGEFVDRKVIYVCKICGQTVRYDQQTGKYYHELGEDYRQLETIAREVKEP